MRSTVAVGLEGVKPAPLAGREARRRSQLGVKRLVHGSNVANDPPTGQGDADSGENRATPGEGAIHPAHAMRERTFSDSLKTTLLVISSSFHKF